VKKNLDLAFKIIYFLLTLISFNLFFARDWYISYISYAVIGFGIIVGVIRLLHIKDYLNAGVFLLLSFIFSYVLGTVTTFEYGYMDNIKAIIWMAVQYFLVFGFDKKEEKTNERDVLFKLFLIYTGICASISIWMMITHWQRYDLIEGIYWVQGGFIDNRLFGCYVDPNYGAIFAIVSMVISALYLTDWKEIKVIWKVLLIINIVLEFLYLCYSDSRTGMVAVAASVFTLIFLWFLNKKGFIKTVALALASAVVLVALVYGVQKGTSFAKVKFAEISATKAGATEEEIEAEKYLARVGRIDDQIGEGSDISNNRIAIWGNAIEMFKQHPITGISYRNIREYAEVNIPDTYVGFESMHNAFFDVLVSQGIMGMIILVLFIAWVFYNLFKKYKSLTDYKEFAFLMAIIAAIFVSMLTYSEVFYMNTGGAFLFWYVLGYLINSNCDVKEEVKA